MTASTAITAQGATLQVDKDNPGTPDLIIANFLSWQGFDGEASEIDITHLGSVAKEKMTGLQDFGNFTCEIHTDPSDAGQAELVAAQASGAEKTFLLTLSDNTTYQFAGRVKNASSLSGGVDAPTAGSVSIAVSGAPTITPGG